MPPKIYFSDAQKANDLKKNQKPNKPKVVKSSAAQKSSKIRKQEVKQGNNKKPSTAPKKVAINKIKININNKPKPNAKPTPQQNKPKTKTPPQSKLEKALQTAKAISSNPNHFNHQNVKDLLNSYQKSWISAERFQELLLPMLI